MDDRKIVGRAERLNRRQAFVDRLVPKAGRFGKHEHVKRGHHSPHF